MFAANEPAATKFHDSQDAGVSFCAALRLQGNDGVGDSTLWGVGSFGTVILADPKGTDGHRAQIPRQIMKEAADFAGVGGISSQRFKAIDHEQTGAIIAQKRRQLAED